MTSAAVRKFHLPLFPSPTTIVLFYPLKYRSELQDSHPRLTDIMQYRSQSFSSALPSRRTPSARPPLFRAGSSKSFLPRKLDIPVPPTLASSPLLLSPHSMFRRPYPLTRLPSQRDEEWLRDTVPVSAPTSPVHSPSPIAPIRRAASDSHILQPVQPRRTRNRPAPVRWWSTPDGRTVLQPPLSPPLVHWRMAPLKHGCALASPCPDRSPALDRQVSSPVAV